MPRLTAEEFQQRAQAIGTCEDETERRTLLAALITDGNETFTHFATVETERDTARNDNEKLREANMALFLKVGDPSKKPEEEQSPDLKYEDLFNEKGELK